MLINSTAVIFAGGKSSRMGEDKSLLPFGGCESMSEYQYHKLSQIFSNVYISCKDNKFDFDAPLILDSYSQSSPLVGLISIFEYLESDELFILSVDAPFVDIDIIKKLYLVCNHYDAIIAKTPSGTQPLCGIYRRSILPKAKEFLAQDNHKLNFLLKSTNTVFVEFESDEQFMNLNHPHEYQKALSINTL
ncbi:MAG: molybdenum cofactor guanylyltransferase MobA [Campylobacterota bacterium]|nr:molybdenum cofactor guanylyltransferase MobA [Campylobacterota bacterium]